MSAAISTNLIVIPARMAASRLPGKPMKDIGGVPMIVHVWRRAIEADIGPVIIATDAPEIKKEIESHGGIAIMTSADHQSGSDRIYEAVNIFDKDEKFKKIINLQGDLPTLEAELIHACAKLLDDELVDISTLAVEIVEDAEKTNPNVVKMIGSPISAAHHRALYFTRATAPAGEGPLYHHIGIYGYQRESLKKFISLQQSTLEKREKLEQLRAIEAGMRIDVAIVDTHPLGVDTKDDLDKARALLSK